MKVHYETIDKAIRRVIDNAERNNRHIAHIELTPSEWAEMATIMVPAWQVLSPTDGLTYMGIPLRKEQRK